MTRLNKQFTSKPYDIMQTPTILVKNIFSHKNEMWNHSLCCSNKQRKLFEIPQNCEIPMKFTLGFIIHFLVIFSSISNVNCYFLCYILYSFSFSYFCQFFPYRFWNFFGYTSHWLAGWMKKIFKAILLAFDVYISFYGISWWLILLF